MASIADAVIVGAGALGCAAAFYLTQAGVHRTIVVDKGPLVSGMTRRHAGLVHTHLDQAATMRLAVWSLETFRHWGARVGGACGFTETGLIVAAPTMETATALRRSVELQQQAGAETRLVERAGLESLFPQGRFAETVAAAFEPQSGYIDPVRAAQGFAQQARERGARFETGTLVRHLTHEHGRVTGLATTTGEIEAPVLILTAGAGSDRLLAPLGVSLNLRLIRGIIGFFEQPAAWKAGHPAFLDQATSGFIRPHSFHLSAVGVIAPNARPTAPEGLDEAVSEAETRALIDFSSAYLPGLAGAPLTRAHPILYDRMPDGQAALGPTPEAEGLFVAVGFAENAIALAPAVGKVLADWIVDGRPSLDVESLRLTPTRLNSGAAAN